MASSIDLSVAEHCERAAHHGHVGRALISTGEAQWGAVCFFYAAYHLVRAALTSDPIFLDPTRLSRMNPELTPSDQSVGRHKGRRQSANGREWGVNELVALLYPRFMQPYERLHQASIDVRYYSGLRASSADLEANLKSIEDGYASGKLVAAV